MTDLLALVVDELGADTGAPRAALVPLGEVAAAVTPWFTPFLTSAETADPHTPGAGDHDMATEWITGLAALAAAAERRDPDAAATACEALSLSLHVVTAADAGAALAAALAQAGPRC